MRCLTKCLALFGLGHYIYAGEDVPGNVEPEKKETIDATQISELREKIAAAGLSENAVCAAVRINKLEKLETNRFDRAIKWLESKV